MSDASETSYGFKRITAANWQEPDVPRLFGRMTAEAWIEAHLTPQLSPKVPKEIAALFEVARGSMIYGWFFYPLLTLASEQCYRVLEAAARHRCAQAGILLKRTNKKGQAADTSFANNIKALVQSGVLPADDTRRWEASRTLRNMT
jgi:hypothetical protein